MPPAVDVGLRPQFPIKPWLDNAIRAENLGFDGVWVSDCQTVYRECYVAMTAAAMKTSRVTLITGVTNPITRDLTVIASAIASINELSGGRARLGIARGSTSVDNIGHSPASSEQMKQAITTLRTLLRGESATHEGQSVRLNWTEPPFEETEIPVYMAASGPRSLQLAGEEADGVLFQVGSNPELVEWALEKIERGARLAGKSLEDVDLCMRLGCSVFHERDKARRAMRSFAATAGMTVAESLPRDAVPEHLRQDLQDLLDHYDQSQHGSPEAEHLQWVTDQLMDAAILAGTPDDVIPRLNELSALGIDRFVLQQPELEPNRSMQIFAEEVQSALE